MDKGIIMWAVFLAVIAAGTLISRRIKKEIEETEKHLSDAPLFYIAFHIYEITKDKNLIKQLGYHIIPLIHESSENKEENNLFIGKSKTE